MDDASIQLQETEREWAGLQAVIARLNDELCDAPQSDLVQLEQEKTTRTQRFNRRRRSGKTSTPV